MKGKVLVQDANLYSDLEFDVETKTFTLLVDVLHVPSIMIPQSCMTTQNLFEIITYLYLSLLLLSLSESSSPNRHRSLTKPFSTSTSTILLFSPPSPRSPRSLSLSSPPPTRSSNRVFSAPFPTFSSRFSVSPISPRRTSPPR